MLDYDSPMTGLLRFAEGTCALSLTETSVARSWWTRGRPFTFAELVADGIVHGVGLLVAAGLGTTILVLAASHTAPAELPAIALYVSALVVLLSVSLAFNLCPIDAPAKRLLARLDQAAIFLFIAIYTVSGGPLTNIQVIEAAQGKPAYEAGIRAGDIITAVDGVKLNDWSDGVGLIGQAGGREITLSVLRNHPIRKSAAGGGIMQDDVATTELSYEIHDQETLAIKVVPEGEPGSARIGISLAPNNFDFQILPFSKAVTKGVNDGVNVIVQTVGGLFKMFTRQTQADVAGPVKIMKMIKDQSSKGIFDLLYLTAILSVNIGLINLLPLPVLDGGRIVFVLLEVIFWVINRLTGLKLAITTKVEETVHFAGMIALLSLLVFVTYKDIASFF